MSKKFKLHLAGILPIHFNIAYLFVLFFSLSDCGSTHSTPITTNPKVLHIDYLYSDELSENATQLSTQNDEVRVYVFRHIQGRGSVYWTSPPFTFTDSLRQQTIDVSLTIDSIHAYYVFFLVELDEPEWRTDMVEQLKEVTQQINFPVSFDQRLADDQLGDDDLLGMAYIDIAKASFGKHTLVFTGLQLFDRYRYRLRLDLR